METLCADVHAHYQRGAFRIAKDAFFASVSLLAGRLPESWGNDKGWQSLETFMANSTNLSGDPHYLCQDSHGAMQ